MLDFFKPRLSAPGTNRREDEEQYWVNFIEMIEGNISLLMAVVDKNHFLQVFGSYVTESLQPVKGPIRKV